MRRTFTRLKTAGGRHFDLSDAILPDALSQESPSQRLSRLLPVSALVSHLPVCRLSAKEIFFLACGGAGDSPADGFWQIFSPHGRFAGVAQAEKERLRALVFLPWTREKGGWQMPEESKDRALVEKLAFSALVEQRAKRRWGVFFKLLIVGYVIALSVYVIIQSKFEPSPKKSMSPLFPLAAPS